MIGILTEKPSAARNFAKALGAHIKDFGKWINHIKEIYDERTSLHFIQSHQQVSFFTLEMNQYLSDIIEDLYWKKEFHDSYSLRTISTYTPEK